MKAAPARGPWLDRKIAFRENPEYESRTFEEKVADMTDDGIRNHLARKLSIMAFDPGGTTGWSIMRLDPAKLLDKTVRPNDVVTGWHHGEIDCGAQSGSAGTSAIAQGGDLGHSETGEAAGVFLCERLIRVGAGVPRTVVVVEDFILRTQSKGRDALSPVRITGGLDQLLWEGKNVPYPLTKQQPSEAKSSVTDERLKLWGFYESGSRHARDADRHALLFLRKVRASRAKMFAAWPLLGEAVRRDLIQL
ncbi:RuvC-like resolvase [Gordonia phage Buggaboo]|uniref:RuvC-like resolvase n=1 Tax=Gordonia phage Buggaboo TaxID=2315529 RepID=A0A386KFN4_9CAUD|nr:RuvC-like resolvase [Gordonia phage Buggaboo]AVE00713.1 RuvC-like resolvase [Gordonia phage SuperSulley]AYD83251.1 RuvC-like resolvase [Gordonia phage Buggaboo]